MNQQPKLTLAWRLLTGLWERDEDFAMLLAHLRKYPAAVDEVVLFLPSGDFGPIQAVRYAWACFPVGNLYNKAGLPAAPFRTDR